MSSNFPQPSSAPNSYDTAPSYPNAPLPRQNPAPLEWIISAVLFCTTLLTTSYVGLFYCTGNSDFIAVFRAILVKPRLLADGFSFSIPLTAILLAHELGHFIACRHYGMRCTPPFFLPMPFPIAGTFGAFIRIKSPFPTRRALFDVGVAGPLAGFAFLLPFLCLGISLSKLFPKGMLPQGPWSFGEPLIFRILGILILGYSPNKQDMIAHPTAIAAWIGLLATSLNLLPIWQLDGGHIVYAFMGRSRHKKLSIASLAALMLLSILGWPTPSYLFFGVLLLIIGARLRFYHPPTLLEEEGLGAGRLILGLLALLVLIASFIPVPIVIN